MLMIAMEALTEVNNDAGNPYLIIIGQLLLEELKCIRREIKEELRRVSDKFQDFIESTKYPRDNPLPNFHQTNQPPADGVGEVEQNTIFQSSIKAEVSADVDCGFPQSSIDLTDSIQDLEVPKLPQVTTLMKEHSYHATSFDPDVSYVISNDNSSDKNSSTDEICNNNNPDKNICKYEECSDNNADKDKDLETKTSSCSSKRHVNGKRTRKSFPRKLQVNTKPSNASDGDVITDDEDTREMQDDKDVSDSWLQFATIGKNVYFCNECQQNFSQRENLKSHCQIHVEEKTFKCDVCCVSFPHNDDLEYHLNNNHSFVLPTNVEIKVTTSPLKTHKAPVSAKPEKKLLRKPISGSKKNGICTIVNQCVPAKKLEKDLQEMKSPKRRSTTNHKFILPLHHRKNIKIKNDRKFYHCDICFKTFVYTSQSYQRHMMIHTGERPYKCDFCNKGFIRAANLKMHVRIHTGEKPYKCHLCSKQFRMRSGLTTHLRSVHSTDADFVHWV